MIILHLLNDYNNITWIDQQFKRELCIFQFDNFPVEEVTRKSWIALHIGDSIQIVGKLDDAIRILNSKTYRIYLKPIIGIHPHKYYFKNNATKYEFAFIDDVHTNGKHAIKINDKYFIIPKFPE